MIFTERDKMGDLNVALTGVMQAVIMERAKRKMLSYMLLALFCAIVGATFHPVYFVGTGAFAFFYVKWTFQAYQYLEGDVAIDAMQTAFESAEEELNEKVE